MSQSSKGSMPLSKALIGFLQFKEAEGNSLNTLANYKREIEMWVSHSGDLAVSSVTTEQVRAYLSYRRTDYVPRRIYGGNDKPLSMKTIRNHWVALVV